jgi:NAD(P)-dependent dehydrogenase (short-subunit alcohol dehydrogenase family)
MTFQNRETLPFWGRRALVTGGTGGIGRASALGLAVRGADVTVTGGHSRERLEKTLAALAGAADTGAGFLCEIAPGAFSPEAAARFILGRVPDPDILVCAWGPFRKAALGETGAETWRSLTEGNLIFPGIMVSSVLGSMIKKGWGRILLFGGTGTARIRGWLTTAAYSSAKTALGSLAASAAREAAGSGVICKVLCPGLTDTEYCGAEELRYNRNHSPKGKALKPEDIAAAAMKVLEDPETNGGTIELDIPERDLTKTGTDVTIKAVGEDA